MEARRERTASARESAVAALMRVEETGAFVGLGGDADATGTRDARQTREYVAGVTRWKRYLDFLLEQFVRGPIDQLEAPLHQILRVALYDLLFLRTPDHAAVNEAVELTRRLVRPQAGRLANGVLRSVLRSARNLPEPTGDDAADRLAIRYSHPTWMVRRWLDRFGEDDTRRLLDRNNERPEFGVRVDTTRATVDSIRDTLDDTGIAWTEGMFIPYFLRLRSISALAGTGLLKSGKVAIQDESAGLIVCVLDPQPGDRILDLCAAPGGKALHAAQRMGDRGELLAVDVHAGRLRLLEATVSKLGLSSITTRAEDARRLSVDAIGEFDSVLLDAPCSGLGVLARRADLRWNRSEIDLRDLTRLQRELLDAAARFVRPGGTLVYGTCTIEPEENEEQVVRFLDRNPEFSLEPIGDEVASAVRTAEGYMATLPHIHGVDGAFAARFRKEST